MQEDIEALMSEAPGGVTTDVEREIAGREDFTFVDPSRLSTDAGMTAHRGPLVGDEYIDVDVLRDAAEEALGFTYEDVSSVYRQGPLSPEQRQLRDRIDARMLALSRSGGNMTALADTLDLSGSVIDRALVRARAVEVTPIVRNPAVPGRYVSFITGEPGARPRRRRHKGCPSHMLPVEGLRTSYVNLTADEYARGA